MALADGRTIDARYAIEDEIGRGAFGSIHRGRDLGTGEPVAIKRLHRETDATTAERFRLEARILERIDHPHVVRHVAHGVDAEGRLWLVLEWLEGEDVAQRKKRAAISRGDALEIARQAALGLSALHEHGVTHRDVKPANMFLCGPPGGAVNVKVLDLGIARAPLGPALTEEGLRLGTPAYMSPEQVRGDLVISPRSDLFSLGVVLYELLCGVRPFAAQDSFATMMRTLVDEPPTLSRMIGRPVLALDALVARALAKSADARWSSALEFAEAIGTVDVTDGVSTATTTQQTLTEAVGPRHRPIRVITAIFADLAASPDRDAAVSTFESVASAHGGAAQRTLGARGLALFGARRSTGDESVRAARTALAVASQLPGVRLAVTTARVVEHRGAFTGDAIDRGLELLSAAKQGIVLDPATGRLLESHFDVDADGDGFILRGERTDLSESGARLVGIRTRTVGRDRELALLEGLCAEAFDDASVRSALVTAPAGTGKSRIAEELVRRIRRTRPAAGVWVGRGDSVGAETPLGVLAQVIRSGIGLRHGDPLEVRRERLRARVAAVLDPASVRRVTHFLGELIGTRFDDTEDVQLRAARGDPLLLGDQMRRAWVDWLIAETSERPVLIVLEDAHWSDEASMQTLGSALGQSADRPLAVIALARPEVNTRFAGTWLDRPTHRHALGPLARRAAEQLVLQALGERASPERVAQLIDRAGGSPFVLEELVRAFVENRGNDLPETVLALVQSRIDALPLQSRSALRAASVLGRTFWRGGATAIAMALGELPPGDDVFRELERREVIAAREGSAIADDSEFSFAHQIVCDAAYAALPSEARVTAHRAAAAWLEDAGSDDPFVIAEHFERGDARSNAVPWCLRAAEAAREANALPTVLAWTARGIANGAAGELLAELRVLRAEAHRWRGENLDARREAEAALAEPSLAPSEWFAAAGELALVAGRLGDSDALDAVARRLADAPLTVVGPAAAATALAKTAKQLSWAGRYERADALLRRLDILTRDIAPDDPIVRARADEARATRALADGDAQEYLLRVASAAEQFAKADDLRSQCGQHVNLGYAALEAGSFEQAELVLRDALATAERMGLVNMASSARQNLAWALARLARLDEAQALGESTIAAFVDQSDRTMEGSSRIYQSILFATRGNHAEAEREARAACDVLNGTPPIRAYALAALANARLASDPSAALTAANEAFATVSALGSIDEGDSFVRWVHAEALFANGLRDEAARAIASARERVLARAARFTDAALRASFLERIPENAATLRRAEAWSCGSR